MRTISAGTGEPTMRYRRCRVRARRLAVAVLAVVLAWGPCGAKAAMAEGGAVRKPVGLRDVRVDDGFWTPRQEVVREHTIAHSWPYVKGSIEELKMAAGGDKRPGDNGKWMEANLYKVLETAASALAQERDADLERKGDEVVDIVAAGQRDDGFAHAWVIVRGLKAWDDVYHQHDGYVCGHLYEAAVAHFRATGKRNLLEVACQLADHFIVQNHPGFPGHAEIELALVELYRVTGRDRYLELAQAFIERRGQHPERATKYPPAYFQDDVPVRRQRDIKGHAVRAVFFATAVADLALDTGDEGLRQAANALWRSATRRKMYVTGSVGATREQEAFSGDYDLPQEGYCESCAACGLAKFAHRMTLLEEDANMADEMERILYNGVLHGISLDGCAFYYRNPLRDANHPRGNNWTCCPPTLSGTVLQVGQYAYAHTERDLYVNLFMGGSCVVSLPKAPVTLKVKTDYPWNGRVEIAVSPSAETEFALRVRVPGWCRTAHLLLNGDSVNVSPDKGYAVFHRMWHAGDTVVLDMAMPVQCVQAHPKVEAAEGQVAIQRGPIIYGLEALDNAFGLDVSLAEPPEFAAQHRPDLLGSVTAVSGATATGKRFTAIPFYALANRQTFQQRVWLPQAGKQSRQGGWENVLYRPLQPR